MSKYLDVSGLTYLWEKIKEALTGKQNTLTGTEKQLVTFDENTGEAVSMDIASVMAKGTDLDSSVSEPASYKSMNFAEYFILYWKSDPNTGKTTAYKATLAMLAQWLNYRADNVHAPDPSYIQSLIPKARAISIADRASTVDNGLIRLVYDEG